MITMHQLSATCKSVYLLCVCVRASWTMPGGGQKPVWCFLTVAGTFPLGSLFFSFSILPWSFFCFFCFTGEASISTSFSDFLLPFAEFSLFSGGVRIELFFWKGSRMRYHINKLYSTKRVSLFKDFDFYFILGYSSLSCWV